MSLARTTFVLLSVGLVAPPGVLARGAGATDSASSGARAAADPDPSRSEAISEPGDPSAAPTTSQVEPSDSSAVPNGSSERSDSAQPSNTEPVVGDDGSDEFDVEGVTFLLDSWQGMAPLGGTPIEIRFGMGRFSFYAGCNIHRTNKYSFEQGRFVLPGLGATEQGCSDDALAQDMWLRSFFLSLPLVEQAADRITFKTADATLVFLPLPNVSLTGRVWTIDTLFSNDLATEVVLHEPATLSFEEDGSLSFFGGCNQGRGEYLVDDQWLVIRGLAHTEAGCPSDRARVVETQFLAILAEGAATHTIEAKRLVVMRNGLGIGATAP